MKISFQSVAVFFLVFTFAIGACSNPRCDDTLFEITDFGLTPRRSVPPAGEIVNWSNEEKRPVDELLMRITISRNFLNPRDPNSECLPSFETANKLTSLKLLSTQVFSSTGHSQDLFEIAAFTLDQRTFIDKESFIQGYLNDSNFTEFFFVFTQQPDQDATHMFSIVAEFENGAKIETDPIPVFIGRRDNRED